MSTVISIQLSIDAAVHDSDDALRTKAETQVDFVLRFIGERNAAQLWERMTASMGSLDTSKAAFMDEAGIDMIQSTPVKRRVEVENSILEQLKAQRADKVSRN